MQAQRTAFGSKTSKPTVDPTATIAAKTSTVTADGMGGTGVRTQKESANAIFIALCVLLRSKFGFTDIAIARLTEFVQIGAKQFLTENVSVTRGSLITVPVISPRLLSELQHLSLNGSMDQAVQLPENYWQIQDRDASQFRNGPVYFIHDVAINTTPVGKDISETVQQQIDNFETDGRTGLNLLELSMAIFAFGATGVEGSKTTTSTTFVAANSLWGDRTGTPTLTGSAIERISTDQPIDSSYCVPSYGHSSGGY